jgi:hypothetical protein
VKTISNWINILEQPRLRKRKAAPVNRTSANYQRQLGYVDSSTIDSGSDEEYQDNNDKEGDDQNNNAVVDTNEEKQQSSKKAKHHHHQTEQQPAASSIHAKQNRKSGFLLYFKVMSASLLN